MTYSRAFGNEVKFESYGVRVSLQAEDAKLLREAEQVARKALLDRVRIIDSQEVDHRFVFSMDEKGTFYLSQNGEQVSYDDKKKRFFKFFNGILRIAVAEYAPDYVFIHAGVVGRNGKAIVIPANSFRGKTTLVAELVKSGAEYYSDEYAVLDEEGLVHAFPRNLSVRDDRYYENEVSVEDLGGKVGANPIPIGVVLLTEYEENAEWNPQQLTVGRGIMEIIPHTIPRNFNTKFSLKVLNTAVSDAIILKSPRGDAEQFALNFLSFFDNITDLAKIT